MRAVVLVLAACGRIGFDPGGPGDAGTSACPVRDVDIGRAHGCLVDSIGGVYCWGHNTKGQVLPASTAKRLGLPIDPNLEQHVSKPARVTMTGPALKVGVGRETSCALLEDATVWCWGSGTSGELGNGQMEDGGPVQVELDGVVVDDLDVGAHTACARVVADRSLRCWGTSQDGELGVPVSSPLPVAVPNSAGIANLDMGHRHNCAVADDGRMSCWGRGGNDQLAGAPGGPDIVAIPGLDPVIHATASARTTCAVENDGDVMCFGEDIGGTLGDNAATPQSAVPLRVPLSADAVEVAMGIEAACARHANGGVSCWGRDLKADGTYDRSMAPRATLLVDASKLAMSYRIACAIENGTVVCWGSNEHGELGRGSRSIATSPVAVDLGGETPLQVGAGEDHVCARTATKILCWGENYVGQLGDGSGARQTAPVEVDTGFPTIDGLTVGAFDSCAWSGSVVKCWGASNGLPRVTLSFGTAIAEVALGVDHGCALIDGTVGCIGDNAQGQLGDGTTTDSEVPILLTLPTPVTTVVTGRAHTCAIAAAQVHCWGVGGTIGDGSTMQRLSPTPIMVPGTPTKLAAGAKSTCALTTAGEIFCWGACGGGECGNGGYDEQLAPMAVGLPGPAVEVSMGVAVTCARLANGDVFCWGLGGLGQLGNGLATDSPSPVAVPALAGSSGVSPGGRGACAIEDNVVSCWGVQAMLADRDTSTARPLPVDLTCPQ